MKSAGFIVESPAMASLRAKAADAGGIAAADENCQHQVRLVEFTHTKMADAVAEWLDGHGQTVLDYQAAIQLVQQRAQFILEH